MADLIRDTFKRGKVQLINATSFWLQLRKSLGAKRREVAFDRKEDILRLLEDFEDGATRKVDDNGVEREARPHIPDAWIDSKRRDPQDGKVALVGYETNFNRYFYEYRPPRPLEEIEADIWQVEKEVAAMLEEMRV